MEVWANIVPWLEKYPGTHWIGDWVSFSAGQGILEKSSLLHLPAYKPELTGQ